MRQAIFEVEAKNTDQVFYRGGHITLSEESGWIYDSNSALLFEFANAIVPYPPTIPLTDGYDPDPFGTFVEHAQRELGFKLLTVDPAPPRPEYDANGNHILY